MQARPRVFGSVAAAWWQTAAPGECVVIQLFALHNAVDKDQQRPSRGGHCNCAEAHVGAVLKDLLQMPMDSGEV